jgi:hypothetical protein
MKIPIILYGNRAFVLWKEIFLECYFNQNVTQEFSCLLFFNQNLTAEFLAGR